ncbi:MAG TPA: response regulator [Chromatiales bacterium]|nr:response regulator [Chromatiales bacterium]
MSEQKILFADDDRLVRVTISTGLTQAGYTVYQAGSGEEALEICCAQQTPDLAIMDIRMPGIGGIEAARELYARCGVPFMIFSAYGDRDLVEQATESGALGYLVKPLRVEQLIPAVETALRRAKEINALLQVERNLQTALDAKRNIGIAVGLVMERYGLDKDSAFNLLRDHARSRRRKLAEVAEEMVNAALILCVKPH